MPLLTWKLIIIILPEPSINQLKLLYLVANSLSANQLWLMAVVYVSTFLRLKLCQRECRVSFIGLKRQVILPFFI